MCLNVGRFFMVFCFLSWTPHVYWDTGDIGWWFFSCCFRSPTWPVSPLLCSFFPAELVFVFPFLLLGLLSLDADQLVVSLPGSSICVVETSSTRQWSCWWRHRFCCLRWSVSVSWCCWWTKIVIVQLRRCLAYLSQRHTYHLNTDRILLYI